jgi:hypothetical protein
VVFLNEQDIQYTVASERTGNHVYWEKVRAWPLGFLKEQGIIDIRVSENARHHGYLGF